MLGNPISKTIMQSAVPCLSYGDLTYNDDIKSVSSFIYDRVLPTYSWYFQGTLYRADTAIITLSI